MTGPFVLSSRLRWSTGKFSASPPSTSVFPEPNPTNANGNLQDFASAFGKGSSDGANLASSEYKSVKYSSAGMGKSFNFFGPSPLQISSLKKSSNFRSEKMGVHLTSRTAPRHRATFNFVRNRGAIDWISAL